MQVQVEELRPYLQNFDLTGLMVEELGWNHYRAAPIAVTAGGEDFELSPVAQKADFAVYRCGPDADGAIPHQSVRRQIENRVAQINYEHLIIFVDAAESRQVWQWVKRESGKPPALRELRYEKGQPGTALLQRLRGLAFTLEEEGSLGITDVIYKFQQSLDIERVTKRFYDRFQKELSAFQKFITGITEQGDRDWYASLMLNRLMFVYFIQKKPLLDGDEHYLRNRLERIQEQDGPDQFQRFYREFLLRLFHEGLGRPESDRSEELTALLGKVPYLNGGIFDPHALERDNPEINIPDAAFEQIFNYFDQYQWHLDDRPSGNDNEINPDVLGYIFEKYVNQKQMGAYYTKEDITGYIARNTVIPRLLEMAQGECLTAFDPEGGVWRLLQDDPDNYIYPALGHGVAWDYSSEGAARLEEPLPLPEDIALGLDDPAQRTGWNRAAPPEYALPTETWRELLARRRRYKEVRDKLADGEVQDVNDLITLNLDSERFARDVIVNSEGPELIRAFWHALDRISVLDPACGSGAFLFAALNILEPLYSATLQAMRGFVADLESTQRTSSPNALSDFREALHAAGQHRSERYYILKSIIVNNLYGVDIMEEAVEICRLRLFLKLAAQLETYDQIEPLPDIDFNIQPGNSLVGFTSTASVRQAMEVDLKGQGRMIAPEEEDALLSIENKAASIARQYQQFQQVQTEYGMDYAELGDSKRNLQSSLDDLRSELDALLAREYGVDASKPAPLQKWQASHQPFHWFVEAYDIIHRGGFDVVIGNPPYLEFKEVDYACLNFACDNTSAIHALFIEQGANLLNKSGRISMIVPLALTSTQRMRTAQNVLETNGKGVWYANFAWRPGKLFETVNRALTIFVVGPAENQQSYATGYLKWTKYDRDELFGKVSFVDVPRARTSFWVPKLSTNIESQMLTKIASTSTVAADFIGSTSHRVFYRTDGGLYWKVFTDFAPDFYINGKKANSSRQTTFSTGEQQQVRPIIATLSSDIFWWWYTITSNLRHLNPSDIHGFPIPMSIFRDAELAELADRYLESIKANSSMLVRNQRQTGRTETQSFEISKSKPIIDEIDRVLADHYGFTDEELDFIINYDIKYRMGREG